MIYKERREGMKEERQVKRRKIIAIEYKKKKDLEDEKKKKRKKREEGIKTIDPSMSPSFCLDSCLDFSPSPSSPSYAWRNINRMQPEDRHVSHKLFLQENNRLRCRNHYYYEEKQLLPSKKKYREGSQGKYRTRIGLGHIFSLSESLPSITTSIN